MVLAYGFPFAPIHTDTYIYASTICKIKESVRKTARFPLLIILLFLLYAR